MKEEARTKAWRIFEEAKGKISNVEVAKKVQAHPITVGKWKRRDDWAGKLASSQEKVAPKGATTPVRKKTAHDEAFRSYLEAGAEYPIRLLPIRWV